MVDLAVALREACFWNKKLCLKKITELLKKKYSKTSISIHRAKCYKNKMEFILAAKNYKTKSLLKYTKSTFEDARQVLLMALQNITKLACTQLKLPQKRFFKAEHKQSTRGTLSVVTINDVFKIFGKQNPI